MATTTGQILIGRSHPNDGGIVDFHCLYFMEGDRPSIIFNDSINSNESIVVIPTIERTIDDIFFVIVYFILKSNSIQKKIINTSYIEMYDVFSVHERDEIYNDVQNILSEQNLKVIFNIFENSHLLSLVDDIKKYKINFEVTKTIVKREFNRWSGEYETKGL